MTSLPQISVIVPCYNAGPYILGALDSVFAQDWPNLEVIVVDDGSSDGSAQSAVGRYPGIRLVSQSNAGVAVARNTGISQAKGELIAFLDADDYWLPGKLRAQWALLAASPTVRMVCTEWLEWHSEEPQPDQAYLRSTTSTCTSLPDSAFSAAWMYARLLLDCEVWTSTVLMRRSLLDEIGAFDESLKVGEDYDLWLRASRVTPIGRIARPMALYRKHLASITRRAPPENHQAIVVRRALERWGYRSPDGTEAKQSEVDRAIARSWRHFTHAHLASGEWAQARRGAASAIQCDPLNAANWRFMFMALVHARVSRRRPNKHDSKAKAEPTTDAAS